MSISFNGVSPTERLPLTYIEFDNSHAVQGTPGLEYKVLFMGYGNPGFVSPFNPTLDGLGAVKGPMRITSAADADKQFGQGSQLAIMLKAAIKANPNMDYWAIGLAATDLPAPIETNIVLPNGPATKPGVVRGYVGDQPVGVSVYPDDTKEDIAYRLSDAIAALPDAPVTPVGPGAGGSNYASIQLAQHWDDASAQSLRIGPVSSGGSGHDEVHWDMTQGAGNDPDILGLFDGDIDSALGDTQFNVIVTPWLPATVAPLMDVMHRRWGARSSNDGIVFGAATHDQIQPEA